MKKTNKGFSLVELIIVIAIMAILAGAIAPALIKYIDKSRKSNDVSSAKTIKTSVETALGNELVYEKLVGTAGCKIIIFSGKPCSALSTYSGINSAISIAYNGTAPTVYLADGTTQVTDQQCATLIGATIGEKTPKIKYKKESDGVTPTNYYVLINEKGTVEVGVTEATAASGIAAANCIQLAPVLADSYQ